MNKKTIIIGALVLAGLILYMKSRRRAGAAGVGTGSGQYYDGDGNLRNGDGTLAA